MRGVQRVAFAMSNVIPFPVRKIEEQDELRIDLLTAVDVAIRDLRDIAQGGGIRIRERALECMQMLETALHDALQPE